MTNYSNEELFGLSFLSLLDEQQTAGRDEFVQERAALYAGWRDQVHRDIAIRRKDGSLCWVSYTASVVKNSEQQLFQFVAMLLDITERYQMSRAVEKAHEQAQIMTNAAPLACVLLDENTKVIDCNPAAMKLFQAAKEDVCEQFFNYSPEWQADGRPSKRPLQEYLPDDSNFARFEWIHQTADKTPIPSEVTVVRIKRDDKIIIASYIRDLRETIKMEKMKELDRQRTDILLELVQMTQNSQQEIIDFVLQSAVSLTESTAGYVTLMEETEEGLPFRCLILDQHMDCTIPIKTVTGSPHTISPILSECFASKKAVIHDDVAAMMHTVFPECHIPIHAHMNIAIMNDDVPIGFIGVGNKSTPYTETDTKQLTLLAQGMKNLINRKQYAAHLKKSCDESERANRAKSEFLAHMSHEIRTPLNGVIGLSDLLEETPLNRKQKEYVQFIKTSGHALLYLINNILDFSKIEAGKLDVEYEPFDLMDIVGNVLTTVMQRASDKNLELGVSFNRNIPRTLRGDAGRVRQILLNLVGNAVKFTREGGIRIHVSGESDSPSSLYVKFEVIDTGIGIPQGAVEHLFDAFTQADSSYTRVYGGTGLGLAISMQLVRLMKGEIGVTSVEGKGSTFWFSIPFACDYKVIQCLKSTECADTKCSYLSGTACSMFINKRSGLPSEKSAAVHQTEGHSVLIVDDNAVQREALRIQLENWGMKCTLCSSSHDALRLSTVRSELDEPFDLWIIDSTLEDGLGVELADQLLEQKDFGVQIILLNAISDNYYLDINDSTQVECITKPVLTSTLFNAVMDRIFAADKRKDVVSGVLTASRFGDDLSKTRASRYAKPVIRTEDRLKSHLAGKIHILIVEDNRVNQIVAKNVLAAAGFTCDIANNGSEACQSVQNQKFDLIFMDCQMPEMDGFEATDLIRKWELELGKKRTPIVALTANAVKEDIQKCFDVGMDDYCAKPINPKTLIRLIETWYEK